MIHQKHAIVWVTSMVDGLFLRYFKHRKLNLPWLVKDVPQKFSDKGLDNHKKCKALCDASLPLTSKWEQQIS